MKRSPQEHSGESGLVAAALAANAPTMPEATNNAFARKRAPTARIWRGCPI